MAFGRRWVKKEELRRLEDIAARVLTKTQSVCIEMENEYRQKVEEKGYRLHCAPDWYGEGICARIGRKGADCTSCADIEAMDLLPDSFKGYHVKVGYQEGIIIHPIYIDPEIMRRSAGEVLANPVKLNLKEEDEKNGKENA
ncbi:MAG: hypothetical protein QME12_04855 [Nanoarchaeota archaeon]|nr:hypothetical protein [Nanoarchaeota archaeon]